MNRTPWAKRESDPPRLRGRANTERRLRIALRDGFLCSACHRVTGLEAGEADHVVPLHKAGADTDANLQWMCKPCHADKSLLELGKRPKKAFGIDGWPIE